MGDVRRSCLSGTAQEVKPETIIFPVMSGNIPAK